MLRDIAAGRITRVVALGQDRVTRRPEELESTMVLMRSVGIDEISTVADGTVRIKPASGKLMARVKGAFDAYYSDYISEKVSAKKDELAERGLPSGGGSRPFGYEADKMTVRDAEADLVRDAARRLLAGESMLSVCRDFETRGIGTVTGARWLPNVLRGILAAPRVAGLREHRGQVIGAAAWPAILDRDTWEQLRALFESRQDRASGLQRQLLTGLLRCGRCGTRMVAVPNNRKRAYQCVTAPGIGGCGKLSVIAQPVEDIIVGGVLHVLDTPALVERVGEQNGARQTSGIGDIEGRLAELAELWAAGDITSAEWARARRSLDEQLTEAKAGLAARASRGVLRPYLAVPGLLGTVWADLDLEQQRAILAAVIDHVTVQPAAVRGRHSFDPTRLDIRWLA